jgi:hypothetical protein
MPKIGDRLSLGSCPTMLKKIIEKPADDLPFPGEEGQDDRYIN